MISLIPSPSVSLVNGRPSVSSLKIAEHFGKRHDHVVRDIRRIMAEAPEDFRLPNFGESSYMNEQGKEQPMFNLSRNGFMLVVMGYTGTKAMQIKIVYIGAFDAMEKALLERTAPKAEQLALPDVTFDTMVRREAQTMKQHLYAAGASSRKLYAMMNSDAATMGLGRPGRTPEKFEFMDNLHRANETAFYALDNIAETIERNVRAMRRLALA